MLNKKWISILQLVPGLFRVPRSPGLSHDLSHQQHFRTENTRVIITREYLYDLYVVDKLL